MKVKIEEHEIDFIPFDVILTMESVQEARLLWHLLNYNGLKGLLQSSKGYQFDYYNQDIADNLCEIGCHDSNILEKFLNDRGYSIKK